MQWSPEVPFYDAPVTTLKYAVRVRNRQIGTLLGKDGDFTGDAGCGCHPLWWLLAAAAAGVALGVAAKGDKKKRNRRRG